jgi:hypothetical protein
VTHNSARQARSICQQRFGLCCPNRCARALSHWTFTVSESGTPAGASASQEADAQYPLEMPRQSSNCSNSPTWCPSRPTAWCSELLGVSWASMVCWWHRCSAHVPTGWPGCAFACRCRTQICNTSNRSAADISSASSCTHAVTVASENGTGTTSLPSSGQPWSRVPRMCPSCRTTAWQGSSGLMLKHLRAMNTVHRRRRPQLSAELMDGPCARSGDARPTNERARVETVVLKLFGICSKDVHKV